MTLVEPAVKSAAYHRRVGQGFFDCAQMRFAEFGVGMLKDEDVTGRERGAVVHLLAAIWVGNGAEVNRAIKVAATARLPCLRGNVDDDDFEAARERRKCGKKC